jgi:hypothetical protein
MPGRSRSTASPAAPAALCRFAEHPVRRGVASAQEIVFYGTYDRAAKADRYRKIAAEYAGLAEAAADPFLGSYYLRIAEDYQDQSQRELRALEREQITALAAGADIPSARQPRRLAQKSHQATPHETGGAYEFNLGVTQRSQVTDRVS